MTSTWKALFCCFSPEEEIPVSKSARPKQGASQSGRRTTQDHPPAKAPHSASASVSSSRGSHQPAQDHSHSAINAAAIPLDYVNGNGVNSTELAMKGRRHSLSILNAQSSQSSLHHGQLPKDARGVGTTPSNGSTSLLTPGHNPPTTVAHAGVSHQPPNYHNHAHGDHGPEPGMGVIAESSQNVAFENTGLPLLPPQDPSVEGRKCLVLDLDETLVHSSFKFTWNADFVIPVEIEGTVHDVYVIKRPGVDEFLRKMSTIYEVVVFTASVAKYGDPLLDRLDPDGHVHHRLFRESCYNFNGSYVKNLATLGRPLPMVIIVDNSPAAYAFQPFNAVPVSSWFSDIHDNELLDMVPFLDELASQYVPNVTTVLRSEW